jgi:hypothetical protein
MKVDDRIRTLLRILPPEHTVSLAELATWLEQDGEDRPEQRLPHTEISDREELTGVEVAKLLRRSPHS